jgi:uncharacterized protein
MHRAVLDTGVLVSALLKPIPGGASFDLLRFAGEGKFALYISEGILAETARVLLTSKRNRARYNYTEAEVATYSKTLLDVAVVVTDPPTIQVVRDPNDDMILACAIAAKADYLIARDKDLLSLVEYEGIKILTPEAFLGVLRKSTEE